MVISTQPQGRNQIAEGRALAAMRSMPNASIANLWLHSAGAGSFCLVVTWGPLAKFNIDNRGALALQNWRNDKKMPIQI